MQNKLTQSIESILVEKKSFQLYKDTLKILDRLTDEQAGKLFRAIVDYNNGETPNLDETLSLVFFPFENQFIRDVGAYINKCEINKENGSKGGRPIKTQITQSVIQKPKKADKDKDTEKEKESDTIATHSHFLDFNFYKTAYIDLPIELQTNIENQTWQTWQTFNQHIDSKCKRIRQIPEQMNFNDYLEYRDRYIKSGLIDTLKLKTMLSKFNNCQSAQKYISVYDGLIDWTEREITYLKVV